MRISVLVVAAAMLVATPSFAQVETLPVPETTGGGVAGPETPAATQEPAAITEHQAHAAADTAAEPELVCRNVSSRTESRLRGRRERVCKTQTEWDAQEAASNQARSN